MRPRLSAGSRCSRRRLTAPTLPATTAPRPAATARPTGDQFRRLWQRCVGAGTNASAIRPGAATGEQRRSFDGIRPRRHAPTRSSPSAACGHSTSAAHRQPDLAPARSASSALASSASKHRAVGIQCAGQRRTTPSRSAAMPPAARAMGAYAQRHQCHRHRQRCAGDTIPMRSRKGSWRGRDRRQRSIADRHRRARHRLGRDRQHRLGRQRRCRVRRLLDAATGGVGERLVFNRDRQFGERYDSECRRRRTERHGALPPTARRSAPAPRCRRAPPIPSPSAKARWPRTPNSVSFGSPGNLRVAEQCRARRRT